MDRMKVMNVQIFGAETSWEMATWKTKKKMRG
jgi:hypothetical protein